MNEALRSDCPINFVVELLGDKWSLLIVRDMLLDNKTSYSEFASSDEGIATNILTNRLQALEDTGLIMKHRDPSDRRKLIYTLTPKGLDLIPLFAEMILWSAKYHAAPLEREQILEHMRKDREKSIHDLRNGYEERLQSILKSQNS